VVRVVQHSYVRVRRLGYQEAVSAAWRRAISAPISESPNVGKALTIGSPSWGRTFW